MYMTCLLVDAVMKMKIIPFLYIVNINIPVKLIRSLLINKTNSLKSSLHQLISYNYILMLKQLL